MYIPLIRPLFLLHPRIFLVFFFVPFFLFIFIFILETVNESFGENRSIRSVDFSSFINELLFSNVKLMFKEPRTRVEKNHMWFYLQSAVEGEFDEGTLL